MHSKGDSRCAHQIYSAGGDERRNQESEDKYLCRAQKSTVFIGLRRLQLYHEMNPLRMQFFVTRSSCAIVGLS
jgi:hypothetical protein